MESVNRLTPVHGMPPHTRLWLALGTAVLLLLILAPWLVAFGPLEGDAKGTLAAVLVMGVPAVLLAVASRRDDLDPRLRQALVLLVLSMGLSVAGNLLRLLAALDVPLPNVPGLSVVSNIVIWAFGLAALLRIPLVPLSRGARWQIATDTVIAVGGLALAIFAIWTLPGFEHAPYAARLQMLAYNAMAAANLVALNLIVVRGPTRPIRRAIWCLAATIIVETTYLVAMQYTIGRQTRDFSLPNSLFFVDYLAYLFAAVFFLSDPQPRTDLPLLPENVRAFNPLPMAAIIGVSVLLLLSTLHPSDPALFPLALGLGALALLLLARVVGATSEILRLAREEAATLQREQSERLRLMGRLAGGIAHIINNLMTVVIGHAGLIEHSAGPDQDLLGSAHEIGASARRASGLAERLRLASGHRRPDPHRSSLLETVKLQRESISQLAGQAHAITWELDEAGGRASVAPTAVEAIMRELILNAVDATADGGHITIRVRDEPGSAIQSGMIVSPKPGPYSILEVEDSGRGIPPDDLSRVCEPFFTTRPLSEGRGLGLSVVYGIVASSGGGLRLASSVGKGTCVTVYFAAS